MNKINAVICGDKGASLKLKKGFIDIAETAYRKFHTKFARQDSLVTALEDCVFRSAPTPAAEESTKAVDEGLQKSALQLLRRICGENPDCIKSVLIRFYPLLRYATKTIPNN